MSTLRIALFGGVHARHDGSRANATMPRGCQRLLGFLLVKRGQSHTREELTNLFWPDCCEDRARACLNTELWRLRRVLEPRATLRGTYLRTTCGNNVEFNRNSDHWLDVAVFEETVSRIISRPVSAVDAAQIADLRSALELYAGELLEGLYDDWVLFERECMRSLYIDGLAYLMAYCKRQGHYSEGVRCGQRILDLDPLREEIHRELMRLYMNLGQRAQALVQFRACEAILRSELDIPPMEETRAIHAEIMDSAEHRSAVCPDLERISALDQAVRHMRAAVAGFEKGQTALRQAVSLVQGLAKRGPAGND